MTGRRIRYSGLAVPPLAWAVTTQLGQITPYVDCRQGLSITFVSWAALFLLSIMGIVASRWWPAQVDGTNRFVLGVGTLGASIFVFALVLEGAASMLLDSCQR